MTAAQPAFHVTAFTGIEAFREGIWFCQHSLEALGYPVTVEHGVLRKDAINIVFGSYVTDWSAMRQHAEHVIVYNWEQVAPEVPWFTPNYLRQLCNAHVWDYNPRNVRMLREAGATQIQYVPLGYVPQFQQMPQGIEQDIDVLFYGTVNARRKAVLDALRAKGLNVVSTENRVLIGAERDAHIARAKVVLNMHYYERAGIFEVARVSYLLANGKAVVSELAEHTDIEPDIKQAIVHGSLAELPDLCEALVKDATRREAIATQGRAIFMARDGKAIMQKAVENYFAARHNARNLAKPELPHPQRMQLGASTRWRFDVLNVDARSDFAPDITLDLSQPIDWAKPYPAWRYGQVLLQKNHYQHILAEQYFQHCPNLEQALSNCLELLADGGTLELEVPHDLSHDAWTDTRTVRAFSEKSWDSIVEQWWRYGWATHRFELVNQSTIIRNDYGAQVLAKNNNDWAAVVRVPRAVDALRVWLRKRPLTEQEQKQRPQARFMA